MTVINLFQNSTEARPFAAGQMIFHEKDDGDMMYVVVEGSVDILVHGTVAETVHEGSIFGEIALIDRGPRSATAIAKTDCKLVPLDEKRFLYMVQETPNFALQVMQIMAERLRRMDALI